MEVKGREDRKKKKKQKQKKKDETGKGRDKRTRRGAHARQGRAGPCGYV